MLSYCFRKTLAQASRWLLCWVAIAQLLLPLTSTAAMMSAPVDSPYYCGNMSAPMLQQLRSMDLPAELISQVVPQQTLEICDGCASASAAPDALLLSAEVSSEQLSVAPPALTGTSFFYLNSHSGFSARAPPQ
ncbi:MAG: hypothetical protein OXT49_02620 [Gammaproteobacteria bacterium]|nr:hypothetical protein [Gammaproteobacteria bacterium]